MLHKQRILAASILRCDAGHRHDGHSAAAIRGRGDILRKMDKAMRQRSPLTAVAPRSCANTRARWQRRPDASGAPIAPPNERVPLVREYFYPLLMSALPQKRTCAVQLGMSALGQKRTSHLFDHISAA